jgi:hypothetical protein
MHELALFLLGMTGKACLGLDVLCLNNGMLDSFFATSAGRHYQTDDKDCGGGSP